MRRSGRASLAHAASLALLGARRPRKLATRSSRRSTVRRSSRTSIDVAAGPVVGNEVTSIPVVLDGLTRTVTRTLEVVALRGRPSSDLRLQIVAATPVYRPQRSAGSVTPTWISSSLPMVDATQHRKALATATAGTGERRCTPRDARAGHVRNLLARPRR